MPPQLALLLTVGFTFWLFRRDFRERPNVTSALWIPTCWLLLIGSRTLAQWLDLFGIGGGNGSDDEGTPVDAGVFFFLILAGGMVLQRRRLQLGEVFRHNRWLVLFLCYCLLSILWADYPLIAFKRWIKILGHPIMTLVLFTEPDPIESITRMMKRCAYLLLPFSILFIKYFPQPGWGRVWNPYGGEPMMTGVTLDKNTLGSMCLILGLFIFCHTLKIWKREKSPERKSELLLCCGILAMAAYLFYYAKSSTSTVSMAIGCVAAIFIGMRFVNPRNVAGYTIGAVVVLALLEVTVGLFETVVQSLGKDLTLTDRVPLWREVLAMQPNAFIGAGFENFWAGERLDALWRNHWWHPRQAHNGYIETYLNLGAIGVVLMVVLIGSAFIKSCDSVVAHFNFGRFRFAFIAAFVFYNFTEAAFKALHPVWFVFYIVAIDYPLAALSGPVAENAAVEAGSEREDAA